MPLTLQSQYPSKPGSSERAIANASRDARDIRRSKADDIHTFWCRSCTSFVASPNPFRSAHEDLSSTDHSLRSPSLLQQHIANPGYPRSPTVTYVVAPFANCAVFDRLRQRHPDLHQSDHPAVVPTFLSFCRQRVVPSAWSLSTGGIFAGLL